MATFFLAIHVLGGSAALASMFIPIVSRKGGALHRRAGWVFVIGMALVSISALVLAAIRLATDPRPQAQAFSMFLSYIAVLTAAGVSTGVRALRRRGRGPAWWDISISSVLVAMALGMAAFAAAAGVWLFAAFALIGILSGASQLAYWLRRPTHAMHWWFEHMGSMLGSCIAATTAFLVVNADRMGSSADSIVVWLAPTIAGAPLIAAFQVYYRRKFAPTARRHAATAIPAPGSRGGSYTIAR
jgi:uncharacterized membrane protein